MRAEANPGRGRKAVNLLFFSIEGRERSAHSIYFKKKDWAFD